MSTITSTSKPKYFVNGDPLTKLFLSRFNLNPWVVTLFIWLFWNLSIVIVAIIYDQWFSSPSTIGLLNDYGWWLLQFTAIPATIFYFFAMPNMILDVLNGLKKNRVIITKSDQIDLDEQVDDFLRRFDKTYSHWYWALIFFVIVLLFHIFISNPEVRDFKIWQNAGEFIFWYVVVFWIFIYFLGSITAFRVIVTIVWLNRIFKEFQVDVIVLHPDGAGGLSPLGGYSVKIAYIIGIYGITALIVALTLL